MRYYWCVNCGYHGDFKIYRARGIKCEICSRDYILELNEGEYKDWAKKSKKHQDSDLYYKSKGKLTSFGVPFKPKEEKEVKNVKGKDSSRRSPRRPK